MNKYTALVIFGSLVLVGLMATTPCAAQESKSNERRLTVDWDWSSLLAVETDPWRFKASVYGWIPWAPVELHTPAHTASAPETPGKIFESLKLAGMAEGEIHKGPFGIFVNAVYYKGSFHNQFVGPLGQYRRSFFKESAWLIRYGASYDLGKFRFGENSWSSTVTLQPYVGGLYLHDNIKLHVTPGMFGLAIVDHTTLAFNTPIVGLNTLWDLTDRWSLRAGGNIGGWNVDSVKETFEVGGRITYHFKVWEQPTRVFAGYRHIYIHYNPSSTDKLKLTIKGPIFGIGADF